MTEKYTYDDMNTIKRGI